MTNNGEVLPQRKDQKKVKVEKKKGWFGKEVEEIPVFDAEMLNERHTLLGEKRELEEALSKRGIVPTKKTLKDALNHTHAELSIKVNDGYHFVFAPSKEDAIKYNIFFQLLSLPLAHKSSRYDFSDFIYTTERILNTAIGVKETERRWVWDPDIGKVDDLGRILPPFERIKDKIGLISIILESEFDHIPENKKENLEEFVKAAAQLVERLAQIKARGDKATKHIEAGEVPEFEQFVEVLKKVAPDEMLQKAKVKKSSDVKKPSSKEKLNLPSDALLDVLSILQALEFADYSEKAKEKALQKLSSAIKELSREKPTPENLFKLGLYAYAVELIKRGEFSRAEEIKKLQ
ncbi:MAG: Uncharacterized protein XD43_0009 [Thermococcales archaeon 44_46]|nr:MAG: Uncharacterized protein XD43_0009 [Thermococcales archaeon 44_46]